MQNNTHNYKHFTYIWNAFILAIAYTDPFPYGGEWIDQALQDCIHTPPYQMIYPKSACAPHNHATT